MAINVVQPGTPSGNSSGVSSRTFSLTGVTAGNSLVVQFNCESQNKNDAIVFPAGWVVKQAFTQNGYSSAVIAVLNNATAGTNSVTVHFASGTNAGYYYGLMSEVSPLAASPGDLYDTATATGGTLTPTSGGTATSQASEIIFSVISPDLNVLAGTVSQTTPSGYTSIYNETNANNYQTGSSAYKVLTTTQAISAAWTGLTTDSQGWVALIWSLKDAIGATAYTLSASAGSFSATGQAASTSFSRSLSASAGSFALTGESATPSHGRSLSAASGAFSLTGVPASTSYARSLSASHGSFALTGESASTAFSRTLPASAGSFLFTGQAATLTESSAGTAYTLTASAGAFSVSGVPASTSYARKMSASSGAFALSGKSVSTSFARSLSASHGAFSLTGESVAISRGFTLTAAPGVFAFSGEPASINRAIGLSASAGAFSLTGEPVSMTYYLAPTLYVGQRKQTVPASAYT